MFRNRMLEGCYESAMTCLDAIRHAEVGEFRPSSPGMKTDKFGRPKLDRK
jgi:hypothetical protein